MPQPRPIDLPAAVLLATAALGLLLVAALGALLRSVQADAAGPAARTAGIEGVGPDRGGGDAC